MTLASFNTIAATINNVTAEQIGRCHAVFVGGKKFYMVESESDSTVEYCVRRSKTHGFQCSCPSGKIGFSNVHHASGVCKHVRWAIACAIEEREAMKEQEQLNAFQRQDTMVLPAVKVPVKPIEEVMGVPKWILTAPVASHMKYAPAEC